MAMGIVGAASCYASSVGCSILASLIYEGSKMYLKNIRQNALDKKIIEKRISEELGEKYSELYESSIFQGFICSPVFKDYISEYIQYIVVGNIDTDTVVTIKINESDGIDIYSTLYERLIQEYDDSVINKPDKRVITSFFKSYFKLAKILIFESIPSDDKEKVFLINDRIDKFQEKIAIRLESIEISIQNLAELKNDKNTISEYKEIVKRYHKILKKKHSKAHIYLLDTFDFSSFYVPPKLLHQVIFDDEVQSQGVEYVLRRDYGKDDWKHIFEYTNIVYITGGAGYGKSLFLNKLINDYKDLDISNSQEYLVVYGDLKTFTADNGKTKSVIDFLQDSMINETLLDRTEVSKELIEYYLKSGRCIILLDALDEVEKENRTELHNTIISYFANENPNNKVCITSRDRGFIPDKDIELYRIDKLDREQIEKYLDNIIKLGKFDPNYRDGFMVQADDLIDNDFLTSFLILSLLINIYKAEKELPENKIDLYEKCFNYIAYRREKDKTKAKFDWSLLISMMKENTFIELARMCFPNNNDVEKEDIVNMLCEKYSKKYESEAKAENAAEHFLKFCSDRTELFVPSGREDHFKFFHRSFFEYFYSQYIFYRISGERNQYKLLLNFDVDSEVHELTIALMKQKDEDAYQRLVDYIFEQAKYEGNMTKKHRQAFNILVSIITIVDDIEYRNRFFNYLLENKDDLVYKYDIHNQENIIKALNENNSYISKITEKYYYEAEYSWIYRCLKTYLNFPDFIKEKCVDEENYSWGLMRSRLIMALHYNFYAYAYSCDNSISSLINDTTEENLENIINNCSMPKKRNDELRRMLKRYNKISQYDKDLFTKYVLNKL